MKAWEAAESFGRLQAGIKAPTALQVASGDRALVIGWQRRPGKVDGFMILLGNRPDALEIQERIAWDPSRERFERTVSGLANGSEYFVTVVAFTGEGRSEIPEMWRVIPAAIPRSRVAQRANDATEQVQVTTVPVGTVPAQTATPVRPSPAPVVQPAVQAQPSAPIETPASVQPVVAVANPLAVATCAACSGDILFVQDRHLFRCDGCRAEYVKRPTDNKLIAVSRLPNGICECCESRSPIVKDGETLRCSQSREEYIRMEGDGGRLVRVSRLDYGVCTCCTPARPLMLAGSQLVVCSVRRENVYRRGEDGAWRFEPPPPPASIVDDINQALANGTAGMLPGGIIVSNNPSPEPNRRRGGRRG